VHIAVVSTRRTAARTAFTARRAAAVMPAASIHVLDVDGSYQATGTETVHSPASIGFSPIDLHRSAARLEPEDFSRTLQPALMRAVLGATELTAIAIGVRPGVLFLGEPTRLVDLAAEHGVCLVARTARPLADDGRWPAAADQTREGGYSPALLAVRADQRDFLDLWEHVAPGEYARWLDVAASVTPHGTVRDPATLVSAWTLRPEHHLATSTSGGGTALRLDGREVTAVDLSGWDPSRPWLLDAVAPRNPRATLSDHPPLAALVAEVTADLSATPPDSLQGTWDPEMTALGMPVHAVLRSLYRVAYALERTGGPTPPDPYDADQVEAFRDWLTEPVDEGPGRYLRAILHSRPDLKCLYPRVPGEDTGGFLDWARTHARNETDYAAELVDEGVARAVAVGWSERPLKPESGVNVVGFLGAELGIGESARLIVDALGAAGVPYATVPVEQNLLSRTRAAAPPSRGAPRFDTTLLCVNADLAGRVAAVMPTLMRTSYRIGMWYWEVEDFPTAQHDGFAQVDEVWVATDFTRAAIEPHSPVPVRTITPPLPQRGDSPVASRSDLGLPEDRPLFLFSFDYLSTVERKNPLGLVDAFRRAFRPDEGPVLVIKSINSDRRPSDAERLRLRVSSFPDVILMDEYLDAARRDSLVALSDCYVSLHRSEGLGLTMAEAMAWGKPVIATGYSGNLQFMTEQNSFLVPWAPTTIPPGADPYPVGGTWADPDVEAAAHLMRGILADPQEAARRGARAADDIRTLNSAEAAGRRVAERLAELARPRRARSRRSLATRTRTAMGQARQGWRSR